MRFEQVQVSILLNEKKKKYFDLGLGGSSKEVHLDFLKIQENAS